MKRFNQIAMLGLAAYAVLILAACSKTDNSSDPSTANNANTGACTLSYDGVYRNSAGQVCSNGTTTVCPSNGYYTNTNGQVTSCTPGQTITTSTYVPPSNSYPYSSYPSSGCDQWTQMYGQLYVPIYLNGTLVCANYSDLVASIQQTSQWAYYQTTPYYQDPTYYYAYPPYSGGGYGGGGSQICIGGSTGGFSGSGCFNF